MKHTKSHLNKNSRCFKAQGLTEFALVLPILLLLVLGIIEFSKRKSIIYIS
ncbi:MAG: hypothetical protein B5M51_09170 [Anaerolinea sp. 4484_236]|nr:MAG: hypothetical protein B5M51_09170 [Anaerolinea sp. 4484_236]